MVNSLCKSVLRWITTPMYLQYRRQGLQIYLKGIL